MDWLLSTLASAAAGNWQQHSAISGELRRLHNSLPAIRVLIDRAEQWRLSNPDLEELLTQLKDAYYDAEDLIDDFAYHDLQRKIDGSQHGQASRLLSSTVTFINNVIAAVPNQVKEIQGRLDAISAELQKVIVLLNLHDEPKQCGVSAGRATSSFVIESEVIGRDEEREKVIALLLQSADGSGPSNDDGSGSSDRVSARAKRRKRENVSVLPVIGIGGVGKTTLAQFVYNDPRVSEHFLLKIWVCVSDFFDVERLTKEIIDNAGSGRQSKEMIESDNKWDRTDGKNLDSLQVLLSKMMSPTRFLLVLDDVWNEDRTAWEKFYAPLRDAHPGSRIITTTRSQKVADIMGTMDSIHLGGLSDDSYWQLFKRYAFGLLEDKEVNHELEAIGRKFFSKLQGSPLAAKTVGSLLNSNMDAGHWRTIMNSEIWELPQKENDILPALRLSYQYLPPHLKHCFSLCSIFPKDYEFLEDRLLDIWIAQGFIAPKENMPLHIVGTGYLRELTTRSFFQPYSPKQWNRYVIHDLMHDLAQLVLKNEAIMIQNVKCQQRIPSTVRHMSIWTSNLQTSRLMEFGSYSKLRTLLLIPDNSSEFSQNLQPNFSSAIRCWFDQLRNIRLLVIKYCKIKELPENISNLKHLRYLDISFNDIRRLPESLGRLYNLQVLAAYGNKFESFPKEFTKLTNLSKLRIEERKLSMVDEIGKLTSLKSLPKFKVLKEHGHGIGELKDLMQLNGKLHITCLENVESREDACQAKLHNKEHLDELVLEWSTMRVTSSVYDNVVSKMEVLEGLRPHLNLRKLEILRYDGNKSPSWLQPQILPYLSVLRIKNCPNLAELSCLYPFLTALELNNVGLDVLPKLWDEESTDEARTKEGNDSIKSSSLSKLSIQRCKKIKSIENWLSPDYLPVIKILHIEYCKNLVSLPTERFKDFVFLEDLTIFGCPKLTCQRGLELPASILRMQIGSCGELEKSLPNCLENLTSLETLHISNCQHLVSLPGQVLCRWTSLRDMSIWSCPELKCLGGTEILSSLNRLLIVKCPKLAEAGQLNFDATMQGKSGSLSNIDIDNTSLLKLPFLRNSVFSHTLTINSSSEPTMFIGEDEEWLQILASIKRLYFYCCPNIKSFPTWLHGLTSLQDLSIQVCPEINSLPEQGLPTSLRRLTFKNCSPMLKEQLEKLKAENSTIHIEYLSWYFSIYHLCLLFASFSSLTSNYVRYKLSNWYQFYFLSTE